MMTYRFIWTSEDIYIILERQYLKASLIHNFFKIKNTILCYYREFLKNIHLAAINPWYQLQTVTHIQLKYKVKNITKWILKRPQNAAYIYQRSSPVNILINNQNAWIKTNLPLVLQNLVVSDEVAALMWAAPLLCWPWTCFSANTSVHLAAKCPVFQVVFRLVWILPTHRDWTDSMLKGQADLVMLHVQLKIQYECIFKSWYKERTH